MKVKVNGKALGKALWNAVKPVLLGAVGGGVIALADGCSSLIINQYIFIRFFN